MENITDTENVEVSGIAEPEAEVTEPEAVAEAEATEAAEGIGEAEVAEVTGEAEVEDGAEPEKKTVYPTQVVLTIRTIVGAYVVYLAYQIITSDSEKSPLMWAAVALFIAAGAGLVIMSVKHFICGEYEGGKKDV